MQTKEEIIKALDQLDREADHPLTKAEYADFILGNFTPNRLDILGSIGDISKFTLLPDGWVRWDLIKRDFGPQSEAQWEKARKDAEGMNGARLGTRLEHFLLYCAMKANLDIKVKFFPNAKEGWYWTEEEWSEYGAWCVDSVSGYVLYDKANSTYVRPVRASQ